MDDDVRVLKALRHLLQTAGYAVRDFAAPEIFLRQHDLARPGCVICDMAMPGMNGLALHRALKVQGCRRPFIFLTGHGTIPGSVQAIQEGAVSYLTKPVDAAVLFVREREVLAHIATGQLNKQIAGSCGVAERTIKFHRANLMRKLGLTTAARLGGWVIQSGLLGPDLALGVKAVS
ncbi:MAG: response regulator [Opitutales bacterium]|nr:response regulator [Opitutales bacterium]